MGGHVARYYALSQPDLFSCARAISPAVDVPGRRFSRKHIDKWWRFRGIFGPVDSEVRRSHDPFLIVRTANPRVAPYIYLTSGEQKSLAAPIRRFSLQLKQHGFAYESHTSPGGHNWNEWNTVLPGCNDLPGNLA